MGFYVNKKQYLSFVILFQCFLLNIQGTGVGNDTEQINFQQMGWHEKISIAKAKSIIDSLYLTSKAQIPELTHDVYVDVGSQAGYISKSGVSVKHRSIINYMRTWAYDTGNALSFAVAHDDPSADARARWLFKHGKFIENPEHPGLEIFAGWPFSMNQIELGDNWSDCRFRTGSNAHALHGLAQYMTSNFFRNLSEREQQAYSMFFANALSGILYHVEGEGPNAGLVTAGWTVNALEDCGELSHTFDQLLDLFGYGLPETIAGYTKPIMRIRAKHVELEDCVGLLMLLNHTLEHFDQLLGDTNRYIITELDAIRIELRDTIFSKLYDNDEGHFFTARTAAGSPCPHNPVDISIWLISALRLEELSAEQTISLSNHLAYTIKHFTREFVIDGKPFFGAFHSKPETENPCKPSMQQHAEALHIGASCSLVCSLLRFARANPEISREFSFRETAIKLWQNIQSFTQEHDFVYSSTALEDGSDTIESIESALWYLQTHAYFNQGSMIVQR